MTYTPPLAFVTWNYEQEKHTGSTSAKVEEMVEAYLECAAWSDNPEDEDWSEVPFAQSAKDLAWFECSAFLMFAKWHIKGWTMEQLGHDFWLTRNGHGAGFWDRDFGTEESREALTNAAKMFQERAPFKAHNEIYVE